MAAKFHTLVDIYRDAIKTYPDNPLFGTKRNGEWRWTTYLEFGKLTDGVRAGLTKLGVGRGDRDGRADRHCGAAPRARVPRRDLADRRGLPCHRGDAS